MSTRASDIHLKHAKLEGYRGVIHVEAKDVTKVTGHFDGKVVTPEDASKLKPNQRVTIEGEPADPEFGTVGYILRHLTDPLSDEDARDMLRAIEEAFETVGPEPDVQF